MDLDGEDLTSQLAPHEKPDGVPPQEEPDDASLMGPQEEPDGAHKVPAEGADHVDGVPKVPDGDAHKKPDENPYPTPDSSVMWLRKKRSEGVEVAGQEVAGQDEVISRFRKSGDQRLCDQNSTDLSHLIYHISKLEIEPAVLKELQRQQNERFYDFRQYRVHCMWQTAFHIASRFDGRPDDKRPYHHELPDPPQHVGQLRRHQYRQEFEQAMADHLAEHRQFGSWEDAESKDYKGHKVLDSKWVFTYKFDEQGKLVKFKARIVARGDQQPEHELPTRATTLAVAAFRLLLAIVAYFDLELVQFDVTNAFVHALVQEVVFMRIGKQRIVRLRKAVYGLRTSPLHWQVKFTSEMENLGFRPVPQEPCAIMKDGIICFFYVDDFAMAYRKEKEPQVKSMVEDLKGRIKLKEQGELEWFLGINVIRDRKKRRLTLSQASYIDKIANRFLSPDDLGRKLPQTLMQLQELQPTSEPITEHSKDWERQRTLYQQIVGSVLYAAISTRADIAFASCKLSQFNAKPGAQHHLAAQRVLRYLYRTRDDYRISYGPDPTWDGRDSFIQGSHDSGGSTCQRPFTCASDSSFADDRIDRKSSQGYVMKLFGGPIAWRANKQDTVTTSSTEAELLAISQAAKEAIYLRRLMTALSLAIPQELVIECDNRQTLRLLTEQSMQLSTKLRHVDIHHH